MGTRQQPGTAFPSAWQPALITPPPPEAGAHYGRCCLFVLLIDAERLRAALLLRSRLRPSVTRRELSSAVSVAWKCNARSSRGDLDQTSCIALLAPHRFSPRSKISSLCQRHPLPRHLVGPFHSVGEDGECMVSTHLHEVSPQSSTAWHRAPPPPLDVPTRVPLPLTLLAIPALMRQRRDPLERRCCHNSFCSQAMKTFG